MKTDSLVAHGNASLSSDGLHGRENDKSREIQLRGVHAKYRRTIGAVYASARLIGRWERRICFPPRMSDREGSAWDISPPEQTDDSPCSMRHLTQGSLPPNRLFDRPKASNSGVVEILPLVQRLELCSVNLPQVFRTSTCPPPVAHVRRALNDKGLNGSLYSQRQFQLVNNFRDDLHRLPRTGRNVPFVSTPSRKHDDGVP